MSAVPTGKDSELGRRTPRSLLGSRRYGPTPTPTPIAAAAAPPITIQNHGRLQNRHLLGGRRQSRAASAFLRSSCARFGQRFASSTRCCARRAAASRSSEDFSASILARGGGVGLGFRASVDLGSSLRNVARSWSALLKLPSCDGACAMLKISVGSCHRPDRPRDSRRWPRVVPAEKR